MSEILEEAAILKVALEHVKNFRTAVDGGANKGTWSLELAKHFDEVLAFEPHAGAFANLARAVRSVGNIRPIEQALGNAIADVGLHTRRKVEFTDSYVDLDGGGTQMVSLDYYKDELRGKLGLLKLDLEGFEYFAVLGAEGVIQENNPVIVVESIPKFDKRFGLTPRQALDRLEMLGYKEVYRQVPNRVFIPK